jgi:hypothetical protein
MILRRDRTRERVVCRFARRTPYIRMALPADYFPREAARRRAVRLLFLAVAIYFTAGLVLRKSAGEIYPALLMPTFAGIGLSSMSAHHGEIMIPHVTVTFSDQTTKEITAAQLSGGKFYPSVLINQFFIRDSASSYRPVSAEAMNFLERRLREIFPGSTPRKVTILINREKFPLDRPNDRTVVAPISQRDIIFP